MVNMKPPLRQVARNSPRSGSVVRRQASVVNRQAVRSTISDAASAAAEIQSSNIRVAVRVRPLNERETSGNAKTVLRVANEKLLIFDPKEDNSFFYHGVKQNNRDFTKKANRDVHFMFDRVFAEETSNQDVFEGTTKDVVDAVLEGFNCSVFAYGATGAGKTHTMLGTGENPGIIFLTVMELYRRMDELRSTKKFEVSVSYLEVYNENVRDLLAQSNFLSIRDNGNDGISVSGLSLVKPNGAEDLLSLLRYGNSNRTQHPTDHNAESSRSHAVFQVWIKQSDRAVGLSSNVKVAKMSLIDLAGSERGCATGHTGERFREGNNINRSLLALGNCINALAEGRRHVPYRDSKLTRLLQDSLGGNCKTVMIAAVSPSTTSFEDTYNTLKYADRAKNIKSNVKKNERSVQLHVSQYEKMISELRAALASSNEKVRLLESSVQELQSKKETPEDNLKKENETPVVPSLCSKCSSDGAAIESDREIPVVAVLPPELQKVRNEWSTLFHERREIQHKVAKLDQLESDFEHKIHSKQQSFDRLGQICLSNIRLEKLRSKLEREMSIQKPQRENLSHKKQELSKRLTLNNVQEAHLKLNIQTIIEKSRDPFLQQIVDDALRMKQLEVIVQKCKDQNAQLNKAFQLQVEENTKTDALLHQLMKTTKSLYLTLRAQPNAPDYMDEDFNNLVALVEGGRICWADQKEESLRDDVISRLPTKESVTLSPLVESDVRLDIPPTSVLCQTRPSTSASSKDYVSASLPKLDSTVVLHGSLSPVPPSSTLDSTVVLQSADLNSTFTADEDEPASKIPSVENGGPLPLTDLPTNVPLQSSIVSNVVSCDGQANKENITNCSKPSISSSIPIRTPNKDPKGNNVVGAHSPKLRRGHLFSKSSSDLMSITPRAHKTSKHGYMAATAASKLRQGLDHQFLEPSAPPVGMVTSRFVSNPFKKIKKSVSTMALTSQARR